MYIDILLFVIGFILLIKGADLLVEGSSSIAKKYGISNIVIGLTIVAFGTSFPELVVSALASFKGSEGVAFGNIIGPNISNTLLILGVCATVRALTVKKDTIAKEIPLSLLAVLAVGFLVNDRLIDAAEASILTRADGLILILFFSIFVFYTFGISKVESGIIDLIGEEKIKQHKNWQSIGMITLGLVGLFFGGRWIVGSAISFAEFFEISETMIGLTIVAIGTSLPELAASGMAAYKGKTDIAIGNVVGSNIFNLLWVLGLSSIIKPISFSTMLNVDLSFLFVITIILLFLIFYGKKNILDRREGILLLVMYFLYMGFLIVRG